MKLTNKIIIGAIIALATLVMSFKDQNDRLFEIAKNLDIYATLFKELNRSYVEEINPNKTIKKSIDAMLNSFDPYTVFYAEDDIEDYFTMTTGKYNGIGIITGNIENDVTIMMIDEGAPAEKAGLKIGDVILKVDGIKINASKNDEISKLIKGQTGTNVKLTIKHYGIEKTEDIIVKRDLVKIKNVPFYGMINNEIGYIDLKNFTAEAAKETKIAFSDLKSKGMKKLVLDVRENPGGLLHMAVEICNMFLPKGNEVVSTKGKVQEWNKTYSGLNPPLDTVMPIVLLANSHSASAAEIVIGVLQDYDRAVLIGQKSFGKGLVQITKDLSFNTKLKVTTAKYYIPSGRCIQAIDYAHRNADGSVGKLPDSLKVAFKTKNGRIVYDGGGVSPDIETETTSLATVTKTLDRKNIIFEYANKYLQENQKIGAPKDFSMDEKTYQNFVKWAIKQDYEYSTQVEKDLETLEASAKKEKYYDLIAEQINTAKVKLSHGKEADLNKFKDEIKILLEQEIILHAYLQKGVREQSFAKDPEIQEAIKLFSNLQKYHSILKGKK